MPRQRSSKSEKPPADQFQDTGVDVEPSLTDAAHAGDVRGMLVALRTRIADTIADPTCSARDMAALSKRLIDIAREIETIDGPDSSSAIAKAQALADAPFDRKAL